jgi:hypothetical protein
LKGDFRLSFTSEERIFDPNLELKFQTSQSLGKCFEYNLREKLAFWTYLEQEYFLGVEFQNILF